MAGSLKILLDGKADLENGKVKTEQLPEGLGGGDGKSAYEIAIDNGFEGTEEEWLESLRGDDGYTPVKGVDYFDGAKGDKGDKGDQGDPGSDATVTKSAVESVLTGEISSHSHANSGGLTQAQILTRQL